MVPILLDLKFIKIYTFGVFLTLAFLWGIFVLWKVVRLTSYKEEDIFDGLFLSLGGALFFGRLVFVLLNFEAFGFNFLKFILINGYPGMSVYGALFGGLLIGSLYLLRKKMVVMDVLDYVASPLFLVMAIGKIGSFFSGGEIGEKTKFLVAIKYTGHDGTRHLTAFYESILFFIASYFCYRLIFEIRKQKYTHGFALYFFIWFFSLVYFLFDKMKGNHLYFLGQSVNFGISGIFVLTFSFYFIYYFRSLLFHKFKLLLTVKPIYGNKARERTSEEASKQTGK